MKKSFILSIVVMLSICSTSFGQINNDTFNILTDYNQIANQYLTKSHKQKITSIVLGIGGGTLLLTGITLAAAGFKDFLQPGANHPDYGALPDVLATSGRAMIVVAIPYTFAYRKNKRKAALYLNKEQVMITPEIKTTTTLVSMGVKINL